MDQWCVRLLLLWQRVIPSQYIVAIMEISSKYNDEFDECNISNTIYKKWFDTIIKELV